MYHRYGSSGRGHLNEHAWNKQKICIKENPKHLLSIDSLFKMIQWFQRKTRGLEWQRLHQDKRDLDSSGPHSARIAGLPKAQAIAKENHEQ